MQTQAVTLPDSAADGLKVRVITPSLARAHKEINSIPLLWNGRTISGQTALRQLKTCVTDFLGLCSSSADQRHDYQECNCVFAQQICKRGIWKTIGCGGHSSSNQLDVNTTNCTFAQDDDSLSLSHPCALCSERLADHHPSSDPLSDKPAPCRPQAFLRTDLPCEHMVHSSCVSAKGAWTCPPTCNKSKLESKAIHLISSALELLLAS